MTGARGTDEAGGRSAARPAPWPIIGQLLAELGPLLVFFVAYKLFGFMLAAAAFAVATAASTAISWYRQRRLPLLPAFATAVALISGGLTLGLEEERYLKMRPTVLNGFYGLALFGSLLLNKPLLNIMLGRTVMLTDKAWRGLTWRTALFVVALAAANEVIWRTQSTEFWVNFKVFGVLPLDLAFILSQWPYIKRHWNPSPEDG